MSEPHTIQHFTHNHPLTQVNAVGTYTCDGCKLNGDGKTYRCSDCDYDLHEYCATCPPSLRNSWHAPDHELSLITGPSHMIVCYVCRYYIHGMFYKCNHCSFESHPLCTHGPAIVPPAVPVHVTETKERKLHVPDYAAQPSFQQHHGYGNPYGYVPMGPYPQYPPGGPYWHTHPPKTDPPPKVDEHKQVPTTTKSEKKKEGLFGFAVAVVQAVATTAIAAAIGEEMAGTTEQ